MWVTFNCYIYIFFYSTVYRLRRTLWDIPPSLQSYAGNITTHIVGGWNFQPPPLPPCGSLSADIAVEDNAVMTGTWRSGVANLCKRCYATDRCRKSTCLYLAEVIMVNKKIDTCAFMFQCNGGNHAQISRCNSFLRHLPQSTYSSLFFQEVPSRLKGDVLTGRWLLAHSQARVSWFICLVTDEINSSSFWNAHTQSVCKSVQELFF